MFEATVGRFCSRDPIGYSAGDESLFLFLTASPLVFTDAEGYSASPGIRPICFPNYKVKVMSKSEVSSMKWNTLTAEMVAAFERPPHTLWGLTLMKYKLDCRCRTCCSNGVDKDVVWWYPDVSLDVWFEIFIRTDKEIPIKYERNVVTREGIYGHEQRHVLNFIEDFNTKFLPNISTHVLEAQKWSNWKQGPVGKSQCTRWCIMTLGSLLIATKKTLANEAGHNDANTRIPLQGVPYPPIGKMPDRSSS
jgi:hypothetical protein